MRRHKPLIGISGPDKGGMLLWWFTRWGIRLAGGRAQRITPAAPVDFSRFQGFVISGGGDINPQRYGEAALLKEKQYDLARDALEEEIIRFAAMHQRPLLGICRGMQMINVVQGGSLYQEAKNVLEDFLPNERLLSKIIGRRSVKLRKDSQLYEILGKYEYYLVNSIHHQAVNKLGQGLDVVAKEENGLVQAIEREGGRQTTFLLGVQWHPELMLHARSSRKIFHALVRAARGTESLQKFKYQQQYHPDSEGHHHIASKNHAPIFQQ